MKIPECLMITMMAVVGFFDWLIYKTTDPPDAFRDDGLGWGLQRRWMEDTYGLRHPDRAEPLLIVKEEAQDDTVLVEFLTK